MLFSRNTFVLPTWQIMAILFVAFKGKSRLAYSTKLELAFTMSDLHSGCERLPIDQARIPARAAHPQLFNDFVIIWSFSPIGKDTTKSWRKHVQPQEIRSGAPKLAVLFCNNHFSTLYKQRKLSLHRIFLSKYIKVCVGSIPYMRMSSKESDINYVTRWNFH